MTNQARLHKCTFYRNILKYTCAAYRNKGKKVNLIPLYDFWRWVKPLK